MWRKRKIQSVPKLVTQNLGVITLKVENLRYNYAYKMQYMFAFYLQIFTGVHCAQCAHVYTKNLLPSYCSVRKEQNSVTYARSLENPIHTHTLFLYHNHVTISVYSTEFVRGHSVRNVDTF